MSAQRLLAQLQLTNTTNENQSPVAEPALSLSKCRWSPVDFLGRYIA